MMTLTHDDARQALEVLRRYASPYNSGPLPVAAAGKTSKKAEDPIFAAYRKTSRVGDIEFFVRSQGSKMTPETYDATVDLLSEAMADLEKNRMPTATLRRYIVLTQRHWSELPDHAETHTRFQEPFCDDVLTTWEDDGGAIDPATSTPPAVPAIGATEPPVMSAALLAQTLTVTATTQKARSSRLHTYRYSWPGDKTSAPYAGTIEAANESDARARIRAQHGLKWVPNGATLSRVAA